MTDKRSMLKQGQVLELYVKLKPVCASVDGFAVYAEGYSDARVAEEFGCTPANVAGLRNRMIGRIRPKPADVVGTKARLDTHEHAIAKLMREVAELQKTAEWLDQRRQQIEDRFK